MVNHCMTSVNSFEEWTSHSPQSVLTCLVSYKISLDRENQVRHGIIIGYK